MERYVDLFDAVERNAMFIRGVDFNRAAERFAARHGKPVVGNCDVHRLAQLGTTYSLVDAERNPDAICDAIAEGRVRVESRPISWADAARLMSALLFAGSPEKGLDRKIGGVDVDDQGVFEVH
jgi:hypothetical protein